MKTAIMVNRSVFVAGATATLMLAALSYAGSAHARDDVFWSVGVGSPGVSLNVGNTGPVYMQAQPVYVQPAPVYYQPPPVYVRPVPVYYQPQSAYFVRPHGWDRHHHDRRQMQAASPGYGGGYGPVSQVYYQQDGRGGWRHDGERDHRR